jgi:predicted ferric reductase
MQPYIKFILFIVFILLEFLAVWGSFNLLSERSTSSNILGFFSLITVGLTLFAVIRSYFIITKNKHNDNNSGLEN